MYTKIFISGCPKFISDLKTFELCLHPTHFVNLVRSVASSKTRVPKKTQYAPRHFFWWKGASATDDDMFSNGHCRYDSSRQFRRTIDSKFHHHGTTDALWGMDEAALVVV